MTATPVREAPAPEPLHSTLSDPAHPAVPDEPVLNLDEIQGNILGGFNKDHQTLVVLTIDSAAQFKPWLRAQVPFVATSGEVIAFNRLFKTIRRRRGTEPAGVKATWFNIAFSHQGLRKIGAADPNDASKRFDDEAFREGLVARSPSLGDPADAAAAGSPPTWVVGGPHNDPADVLLIVAGDDPADMNAEVNRLLHGTAGVSPALAGAHVAFQDVGENLPRNAQGRNLSGHEHFNFLDGVSQPGLRGRLSDDPHDVLTPRQNPNNRDQGKPGQDLLWPGEFVFGYAGQQSGFDEDTGEVDETVRVSDPGPLSDAGPEWAVNGAFLVFRRLRQNVFAFHKFLHDTAAHVGAPAPANASREQLVGSRLVGRWPGGAPVLRTPDQDDQALAHDDCANNNFEFHEDTAPIPPAGVPDQFDCVDDIFAPSPGDRQGARCPFSGHIRKAYPRDDQSTNQHAAPDVAGCHSRQRLDEVDTQTHRLLRRGIPFGQVSPSTPEHPVDDGVTERGLHFLAYQTSIVDQFEFVTRCWVNNPDFKEPGAGHDPIIGQNGAPGQHRRRTFTITFTSAGALQRRQLTTDEEWVIPSGGGYFFAPSIHALRHVLSQ